VTGKVDEEKSINVTPGPSGPSRGKGRSGATYEKIISSLSAFRRGSSRKGKKGGKRRRLKGPRERTPLSF